MDAAFPLSAKSISIADIAKSVYYRLAEFTSLTLEYQFNRR